MCAVRLGALPLADSLLRIIVLYTLKQMSSCLPVALHMPHTTNTPEFEVDRASDNITIVHYVHVCVHVTQMGVFNHLIWTNLRIVCTNLGFDVLRTQSQDCLHNPRIVQQAPRSMYFTQS